MQFTEEPWRYPSYRGQPLPDKDFYDKATMAVVSKTSPDGKKLSTKDVTKVSNELNDIITQVRHLRRDDPAGFFVSPGPKYTAALSSTKRFRAWCAANRAMKTTMAYQVAYWYMTGWCPYYDLPKKNMNIWIVGPPFMPYEEKVFKQKMFVGETVDPFSPRFPASSPFKPKWHIQSKTLTTEVMIDGQKFTNRLSLKSNEQGSDAFFGESVDLIIFDEPPEERIYGECRMRIVDVQGAMLWVQTPTCGLDWFHREIVLPFQNGELKDFDLVRFSLYDNPFIPRSEVEMAEKDLRSKKGEREVRVRIYGEHHPTSDEPAFDLKSIGEYMDQSVKASWVGEIVPPENPNDLPKVAKQDRGRFRIWIKPEAKRTYVVGADPCLGQGNTFASVHVLDTETWDVCADWYGQVDPDIFGRDILANVGRLYNKATVWCERNNHGEVAIKGLKEAKYPRIGIQRRDPSTRYRGLKNQQPTRQLGFSTNAKTKPILIDYLRSGFRDRLFGSMPAETLAECANLSVKGLEENLFQSESLSDRVMSLAFAVYGLVDRTQRGDQPEVKDQWDMSFTDWLRDEDRRSEQPQDEEPEGENFWESYE